MKRTPVASAPTLFACLLGVVLGALLPALVVSAQDGRGPVAMQAVRAPTPPDVDGAIGNDERNFDADFQLWSVAVGDKVTGALPAEYELERLELDPDSGNADTWIRVTRANQCFTRDLFLRIFLQTNSASIDGTSTSCSCIATVPRLARFRFHASRAPPSSASAPNKDTRCS